MSILAERRRRTKWNLNPGRQALWNKAGSCGINFGQGLMEKMGWKVGQGLGVNEQGMKEPLKVTFKNDNKGMGFKENDNEWIQQQYEFNELLGKLSSSNSTDEKNLNTNIKTDHIRTSLEEKLRHSKTRVHYHKFTRGKDLSRYSEKDLKCILGSKMHPLSNVIEFNDSVNSCSELENTSTVIHGGSMVDYFMQKMQNKGSARSMNSLGCDNKQQDTIMEYRNAFGGSEQTNVIKVKKTLQKNKSETKSCTSLMYGKYSDEVCDDVKCNETGNGLKVTAVEKQEKYNKKRKLNEVEINDCLQYSYDEKNGEKNSTTIEKTIENISSVNFPADNIECKSLRKTKKENGKEKVVEECNSGFDNQLESEEFFRPTKRKRNESSVDYLEALSLKKKTKTNDVEKNSTISDECIGFEKHRKINRKKEKSKNNIIIEKDSVKSEKSNGNKVNFGSRRKRKNKTKSKGNIDEFATRTNEISDAEGTFEEYVSGNNEIPKKKKLKSSESASYKTKFFKKERCFMDSEASKLVDIICCANVDKFYGSNLGQVKGYGFLKVHKK